MALSERSRQCALTTHVLQQLYVSLAYHSGSWHSSVAQLHAPCWQHARSQTSGRPGPGQGSGTAMAMHRHHHITMLMPGLTRHACAHADARTLLSAASSKSCGAWSAPHTCAATRWQGSSSSSSSSSGIRQHSWWSNMTRQGSCSLWRHDYSQGEVGLARWGGVGGGGR
jgi:hypothetical protein